MHINVCTTLNTSCVYYGTDNVVTEFLHDTWYLYGFRYLAL